MNNKLSWAIGGSILLHILAYIFLLNVDAEYKNPKKDWTVYKKKEKKVKFKPKKKKKKKKKKPKPKKKKVVKKKKKVVKKKKTKPKPKKQPKKQPKLDLTAGLDANSFGGSGISIPEGTTMADPNAPKKKKKKAVKKPEKKVEKKKKPVKRKPATLKSLPKPVSVPRFSYTKKAREQGIQGKIRLRVTIGKTGKVIKVKVLKGLGYGLDKLAVKALKQAKFKPAYNSYGEPMTHTIIYKYIFVMEDN
ncbi:MAG: energy transducer TonB [Myxococcota bacterium]